MKIFGLELWSDKNKNERDAAFDKAEGWFETYFAQFGETYTGKNVNAYTAMQCVTVYACIKILSETISSLPLILYRRLQNGGKERAIDHPLYKILHLMPNSEMTTMEYVESSQAHLGLRGNAYSEIQRDKGGRVAALWPIHPDRVYPFRDTDKKVKYKIKLPDNKEITLGQDKILHLRGLSSDGIMGLSPIEYNKQTIGLALAGEEFYEA